MAAIPNSPGVYVDITDNTFQRSGIVQVGTAIVGPTPSGPPMVPTLVTSYDEYKSKFGTVFTSGSYHYEYLTSITAKNFFDNGGNTLLVTRIVSGSGATLKTYASGSIMSSGSATSAFTLSVNGFGTLYNGSTTSFGRKVEVTSVDTTYGTFTLQIRRGDDSNINKIVLDTISNVSLDPMQPNYIARVLGDTTPFYNSVTNSVDEEGAFENTNEYIRVKSVDRVMIDSLDSNGLLKSSYVSWLPAVGSIITFAGGVDGVVTPSATFFNAITGTPTNVQGYTAEPYIQALNLLKNTIEYDFKVIVLPGISPDNTNMSTVVASLNSLVQDRGDCIAILDPTVYGVSLSAAKTAVSSLDNRYIATYYPWGQTYSLELGRNVWVPPSVVIPGVYEFNDATGQPWFAPAGYLRGGIPSLSKVEKKLTQSDIKELYDAGINPLVMYPSNGVVVMAQNTLQKRISHMRKVNIVRLVLHVGRYAKFLAKDMLFEQNTIKLRTDFKNKINPYLESIAQKEGLYAYRVVMDETNNTSDVIDRYELRGQLIIQPTITAEIIRLNITVAATGVNISE